MDQSIGTLGSAIKIDDGVDGPMTDAKVKVRGLTRAVPSALHLRGVLLTQ